MTHWCGAAWTKRRRLPLYVAHVPRRRATRPVLEERDRLRGGQRRLRPGPVRGQVPAARLVPSHHAGIGGTCSPGGAAGRAKKTPASLIALSPQEIQRLRCRLAWRAKQSIERCRHGPDGGGLTNGAPSSATTVRVDAHHHHDLRL